MKSLVCVVIGDGLVFGVEIDESKRVWLLKDMIKEDNPWTITCEASQLRLYVAKKGGNWLKSSDPDVQKLERGEIPDGIKAIMIEGGKMDPRYRIGNIAFSFPDEDATAEDELHVLVDIPEHVSLRGERTLHR